MHLLVSSGLAWALTLATTMTLWAAAGVEANQSSFSYNNFENANETMASHGAKSVMRDGTTVLLFSDLGSRAISYTWHKQAVLARGFETTFTVLMNNDRSTSSNSIESAQGVVFILQSGGTGVYSPSAEPANLAYDSIPDSIAVEFDCVRNPGQDDAIEAGAAGHVSIHTLKTSPNSANEGTINNPKWRTNPIPSLCNNAPSTFKIRYEPGGYMLVDWVDINYTFLNVSFSVESTISLLSGGATYMGFTSSCGALGGEQYIKSWTYSFLGTGGSKSVASGVGLTQARAGDQSYFTVIAKDQYGNDMSFGGETVVARVKDPANNNAIIVQPMIADQGNGTYLGSYSTTKAGSFRLEITVNGKSIKGSPFTLGVMAAAIDASTTQLVSPEPTSPVSAGTLNSFTLQGFDVYGNRITTGKEDSAIKVQFEPLDPTKDKTLVRDLGNGNYTIELIGTRKQTYSLAVFINGIQLNGIRDSIVVNPAAAYVGTSTITYNGGKIPTTFRASFDKPQLVITAYDKYGNALNSGKSPFAVQLTPTDNNNNAVITDQGNGMYFVSLLLQTTRLYTLQVVLSGADLAGSPFSFNVVPDVPMTAYCIASGEGLMAAVAGVPTNFSVLYRDVFGNAYTHSPSPTFPLTVSFNGSESLSATSTDNMDGTITFSYMPKATGMLYISITSPSDGKDVDNSPARLNVQSGVADAAQSYIPTEYTVGFTTAKADRLTFFLVQVVDAYGNKGNHGGDSVLVTIKPSDPQSTQIDIIPNVFDGKNGSFSVSFTPSSEQIGSYKMIIVVSGQDMKNSPFALNVLGPDETNNILLAVLLPVVAVLALAIIGFLYLRRRKRTKVYELVEQEPELVSSGTGSSSTKYSLMPE